MPFVHGKPSHQTGFKHSEETKERLRINHLGKKNPQWKGDKAGIESIRERAQRLFAVPDGYERHHIDGNILNNTPKNIRIVTRKEHMKLDGRLTKLLQLNSTRIGKKRPYEVKMSFEGRKKLAEFAKQRKRVKGKWI